MKYSIFLRILNDYRWSIFWWSLGLAAISAYVVYFYPYFGGSGELLQMVEHLPPIVRNLLGDRINLATPEGFFNVQPFSTTAPFIFLFFAIAKGGDAIAGEAERGTLDLLLAHPVSRVRVFFEKWLAIIGSLVIMGGVFWMSMTVSCWIFQVKISPSHLLAAVVSCVLLGSVFCSLTMLLSAILLNRRRTIGIISAYAIIGYLINAYAATVPVLQPYRYATPFYYYNGRPPVIDGLDFYHVVLLTTLAVFFMGLGQWVFARREIIL